MRHELMWREKFVRNGKLWGDLGNVREQGKSVRIIIIQNLHNHNLKVENSKLHKKKKRKKRSEKVKSCGGERIFGDQRSFAKKCKKRKNETTARKRVAENRNHYQGPTQ